MLVHYRERLIPGPAWWAVAASLIAMIAIAYGAALGSTIGVVVAVVLGTITGVALIRTSPVISVSDDGLACGHARLPVGTWLPPRTLTGPELTSIRRGLDVDTGDRVYHVIPAWFAGRGILLSLEDPSDPHSAWLIATRHPQRLSAALTPDPSV